MQRAVCPLRGLFAVSLERDADKGGCCSNVPLLWCPTAQDFSEKK
jgi:hypothetical protein